MRSQRKEKKMLRVPKNTGRISSTANDKPTSNSKGRVELCLASNGEDPVLYFEERGNYGKVRWSTTVQLTRQEVEEMVRSAQSWLDGTVGVTLQEVVAPDQEREVKVTPENEETFELVNGNR